MKKILSLALALVLVLSMSTIAFAAEGKSTWDGTYTATAETSFNEIVKTYTSENNVVVNETLRFTSAAQTTNPDGGTANLTVADLNVSSLTPGTLAVTIPSLNKAGTYEWTIKETPGNTAGVAYSTAEVHVIVLVEYDNTNHALKIANTTSYIKKENGEKAKTFDNTFKSGSFTVAKNVEGNMANENDEFEIIVTLTSTKPIGTNVTLAGTTVTPDKWTNNEGSYTYTSTLNYSEIGGAKTFSDIPDGVTVSVVENTADGKMNGYTFDNTNNNTDNDFSMNVADADNNKAVVVKNTKGEEIATGITLDSMPYILMLAVVFMGLFVFFSKKRMMREN